MNEPFGAGTPVAVPHGIADRDRFSCGVPAEARRTSRVAWEGLMRSVLCLFVIPAMHVSSTANASSWELVAKNDAGTSYYVDTNSIANRGSLKTAILLINYDVVSSTISANGRKITFLSSRSVAHFDCSSNEALIEDTIYTGPFASGEISGTRKPPLIQAHDPDTVGGSLLKFVCGSKYSSGTGSAGKSGCFHSGVTYHNSPGGGWSELGPEVCPGEMVKEILKGLER